MADKNDEGAISAADDARSRSFPMEMRQPKAFPLQINLGEAPPAVFTLHADGRFEGDLKEIEKALATMDRIYSEQAVIMWLLVQLLKPRS